MRIHRCLMIAICGSFLFSFAFASETKVSSKNELSCETLTVFYGLWEDSAFGRDPNAVERAAWIIVKPDGTQIFQRWRNSEERSKSRWKGLVPSNVVAVVHTHPVHRDAKPSFADTEMAKHLQIYVYVISKDGLWVSDPDGKIYRVLTYVDFKELLGNCVRAKPKDVSQKTKPGSF